MTIMKASSLQNENTYPERDGDFDRERAGETDLDRDLTGDRWEDLAFGDLLLKS